MQSGARYIADAQQPSTLLPRNAGRHASSIWSEWPGQPAILKRSDASRHNAGQFWRISPLPFQPRVRSAYLPRLPRVCLPLILSILDCQLVSAWLISPALSISRIARRFWSILLFLISDDVGKTLCASLFCTWQRGSVIVKRSQRSRRRQPQLRAPLSRERLPE